MGIRREATQRISTSNSQVAELVDALRKANKGCTYRFKSCSDYSKIELIGSREFSKATPQHTHR